MFFRRHGRREWLLRSPRPFALKRQLFAWLLITILFTGLSVALVFRVGKIGETHGVDTRQLSAFVGHSFAAVSDDPAAQAELARALGRALHATITIEDVTRKQRDVYGKTCPDVDHSIALSAADGRRLGQLNICMNGRNDAKLTGLIAAATAILVLWAAAAKLARFLTRPLTALIAVTRDLGQGNLKRRVRLRRGHKGELGLLAESINDMAERIEAQLTEQRELLAAVSHEIRSPLARLRISTELLRGAPNDSARLDAIDEEIAGIDTLLGKILANSRLDFGSLTRTQLSARSVALAALERHGLGEENLNVEGEDWELSADPTLLGRALDNLLENAETHARSSATSGSDASRAIQLHVRRASRGEHDHPERAVAFELCDAGPGFDPSALSRIFEPFRHARTSNASSSASNSTGSSRGSLGLGLSLVERIAKAHGGRAWAKNLPQGGACVGLSIALEAPISSSVRAKEHA